MGLKNSTSDAASANDSDAGAARAQATVPLNLYRKHHLNHCPLLHTDVATERVMGLKNSTSDTAPANIPNAGATQVQATVPQGLFCEQYLVPIPVTSN